MARRRQLKPRFVRARLHFVLANASINGLRGAAEPAAAVSRVQERNNDA
jgi:hypothetical protein